MITECIISGNWADYSGGGISSGASGTKILNCTVIDNGAGTRSGGFDYMNSNFTNILSSCILWGNTAPTGPQIGGTSRVGRPIVIYNNIDGGYEGLGNMNADPQFAIDGYHLLPQSPCIDAGDASSDWNAELWPHGKRINMGAYGGTPEASMSPSSVGNIADLNNDGFVNYKDLKSFADKWPVQQVLLREDFDRNGSVNFGDFCILAENWLWEE